MKYSIDNAGKIFPMTYEKEKPGCFKLTATLYEAVNVALLQDALDITIKRFPMFDTILKNGVFWHYLKTNNAKQIVKAEHDIPFHLVNPFVKNNFCYELLYRGNRISLEVFHVLTDATGAMEFLKAICFNYLQLKGVNIENNKTILTKDIPVDYTEERDSFKDCYNKNASKLKKDPTSLKIIGTKCDFENVNVTLDINKIKNKSNGYTITEFIGGHVLYSILKITDNPEKLPLSLIIPINSRKFYNSKTLKNFVTYIRSPFYPKDDSQISDISDCIRSTLRNDLSKDFLDSLIKSNVSMERNFFLNYMFLFIKKRIMKVGYKLAAGTKSTIQFSNLGEVKTPDIMKDFIDTFEFSISPSNSLPVTFSGVSYNGKLKLSFNTNIVERDVINYFLNLVEEYK